MLRKLLAHRLSRNAGALALLQLISYVTPVLVLLQLTRVLGIELFGILAFGVAATQFSYNLLDFGFILSATQKIAECRENKGYVARLIGAIFAIKAAALVLVASAIVLYVVSSATYREYLDFFLLGLVPLSALCFLPTWFFTGIERMFYITAFTIVSKLLYLLMIFVFVRSAADFLWVPIADGISQTVGTAIAIFLIYRSGYFIGRPRLRDILYAIRLTRGFFLSRLAANLYGGGGVVLLGLFGTPATTAVYSIAERFYHAMQQVFSPIFGAIYPYMARERNIRLLMKIAVGCILAAVVVGLVFVLAGPHIIQRWLGPGWSESIPLLGVFALAIVVNVTLGMSGYPLSAILGTMREANLSVVWGALLYGLCAALIVATGHVTAFAFAWTLCLTELSILVYRAIMLWPKAYRLLSQSRPA